MSTPQAPYPVPGTPQAQWAPPPRSGGFNVLGLVSLILTAAVALFWTAAMPFVISELRRRASLFYDTGALVLSQWLDLMIGGLLYLIALGLALAGAFSRHRTRGKTLAYVALGGAATGLLVTIVSSISTQAALGY